MSDGFVSKTCVAVKNRFNRRDKRIWLFGEWYGNKCCDNALYMANYVVSVNPELKVFWAANKGTDLSLLDKRVKVIERGSEKAIKVYKRAGVVMMNQGMVDFSDAPYNYFAGAVTVNLWHGMPWKKIFLDSAKTDSKLSRFADIMALKMAGAKYYLSLSKEFTHILNSSAKVSSSHIIKSGYPRNSIFYNAEAISRAKNRIIKQINDQGLKTTDNTRIIAYMPTFRDSGQEVFSFNSMVDTPLYTYLSDNDLIIVEKNHFADSNNTGESRSTGKCVVNLPDCNAAELMAVSDMLITDYSSCFFDYLVLNRPIIHYIYDFKYYSEKDRGLYFEKEDVLCGDAPENTKELTEAIINNMENPMKDSDLRKKRRKKYMTYEDKDSCRRIYDFVRNRLNL